MEFEMMKRKSLIVWLYTLKQWKQLQGLGTVHFVSRRLKYVVLYVNEAHLDQVMKQLKDLNFVREVELSHRDDIDMTFKDAIPDRIDPDRRTDELKEDEDFNTFFKGLANSLEQKETDVSEVEVEEKINK